MTRGLSASQKRILSCLEDRRDRDTYALDGLAAVIDTPYPRIRARWRWYTTDLLDLTNESSSESQQVTLQRAVPSLQRRGLVQTARIAYPYTAPFADTIPACDFVDQVDLAELHDLEPRWPRPHGRRLWFRLPPPAHFEIPGDDQIAVLSRLARDRPDEFDEFVGTLDRCRAWTTPLGAFLRWLLCGHPSIRLKALAASASSATHTNHQPPSPSATRSLPSHE